MHVELEELLALRDGEGDATVAAHVADCELCAAELDRLRALTAELRALPAERPERDLWHDLAPRVGEQHWRRRWMRVGLAAAGVFLMITVLTAVRGGIEAWEEAKLADQKQELVARSQELEDTVRQYERARAISGRAAGALVEIEDRIASIDSKLMQLPREQSSGEEALELWRQRVHLLDTLVELHEQPPTYAGL